MNQPKESSNLMPAALLGFSIVGSISYIVYIVLSRRLFLPPFLGCCLAPLLVVLFQHFKKDKDNVFLINKWINYLGGITLEIYCSQIFCMPIVSSLHLRDNDYRIVVLYVLLIIVFSVILMHFNRFLAIENVKNSNRIPLILCFICE